MATQKAAESAAPWSACYKQYPLRGRQFSGPRCQSGGRIVPSELEPGTWQHHGHGCYIHTAILYMAMIEIIKLK